MEKLKLLVVDDDSVIQNMLHDFLETDYEVEVCSNAQEALEKTDTTRFDLVISDINMPGMKGYELLESIRENAPGTKTILITAYNADEYIRLARNHGVCNIITKTTPFNFEELASLISGLTSGDIFGIEKHLHPGYETIGSFNVKNSNDAKNIRTQIIDLLPPLPKDKNEIKLVLDELITNAMYHASVLESGQKKYEEYQNINLIEKEYVKINMGMDKEKVCLSILDQQGNLDKDRVLYLIDRHVNAEGVFDESGRGIFMSRLFTDRIVFNIEPRIRTEIIIIYFRKANAYQGYKPLYINQL